MKMRTMFHLKTGKRYVRPSFVSFRHCAVRLQQDLYFKNIYIQQTKRSDELHTDYLIFLSQFVACAASVYGVTSC